MPSIPLAIILIPYGLFLVVFLAFSIFNIFHLVHYGYHTNGFFAVLLTYVCGTILLLGASYLILQPHDWERTFEAEGIIEPINVDPFAIPDINRLRDEEN